MPLPSAHLSYSQVSSYIDCGYRYYLERVLRAPQVPAWWFIGGHAVHAATEAADKDLIRQGVVWDDARIRAEVHAHMDDEIEKLRVEHPDLGSWKSGGVKRGANPQPENEAWWRARAPGMVKGWLVWREEFLSAETLPWEFMVLPNGEPAIEVVLQVTIGGRPFKLGIDRIFRVKTTGELVLVDLKTGKREPLSGYQLALYRDAVQQVFGESVKWGYYWMARTGRMGHPHDLDKLNPEMTSSMVEQMARGVEAEIFLPHVTMLCSTCGVREFCPSQGGDPDLISRAR